MPNPDWNSASILHLYEMDFFSLIQKAYAQHQKYFKHRKVELCSLLSIKTGACPENCAYCPQSGHYKTMVEKEKLLPLDVVIAKAKAAKEKGAKRFCMGAAWRTPPKKAFPHVLKMIKAIKTLGLETCVTIGMLDKMQSEQLKDAGLDYYNHNLDTSPEYYKKIVTTHSYQDRLDTIGHIADVGINVCCGGIVGMGESREDRIGLLLQLLALSQPPNSIPINRLIPIEGTPLANTHKIDDFEYIRTVAVTRILFPKAMVRLSAGRESMSHTMQAWCFMAGANSIFYGDKLLTADNPGINHDQQLLKNLGLETDELSDVY